MASPSSKELPPAPVLSPIIHNGVPERLIKEAASAKERLYSNKTVGESTARRRASPLPPNLSREAYDTAISELRKSLGNGNVELNDKPLVDGWYIEHPSVPQFLKSSSCISSLSVCSNTHDAFHIADQEELVCSAVVYPSTTAEVQSIARWANKHKIPIYPISMGRNVGYGGAAPRIPGSVVVDLGRRMSKILKIDADNASCVVEPGVSYFKLYEEIQRRGLPLWIDCPDLGGGSVLGNAVDRGVG